MYVTGRHGTGEGTVMASLAQISREVPLTKVDIVARDPSNAPLVSDALDRANRRLGSALRVRYFARPSVGEHLADDSQYDMAIVVVPDHVHYDTARAVLEKDIHCLLVKPFTPTVAEGESLVRLQHERGVYAAVEFHKRFDESNRLCRRLIEDGTLGEVRYFVVGFSQRMSIPLDVFRDWSAQSNVFQYLGVHYVDLVYFLTAARPVRVTAVGTMGVLSAFGVETYDSVHAVIQWRGGAGGSNPFVTVMNIGWVDPRCTSALSDQRFTLVGSAARLEVDQRNRGIELVRDGLGIQHVNPYFADYLPDVDGGLEFQGYGYTSIRRFFDDVAALKAGTVTLAELDATRPSFRQGLVSTAVLEAVNASLSHSSRWEDVRDVH
jgi:predicted dehydrogenase